PGYSTNTLLAATDIGVFISHNSGDSWSELAAGLPNTVSIHLDYNIVQNRLRVATHGRGIWEYNGNIIPVAQIQSNIPHEFLLFQNYPNPFNPSTKINFSIPPVETTRGVVSLRVYDVLGNEITTLVNQQLTPGTYSVDWNASNYPSGLYFYRLTFGEYSETKRMVLIK
ncbi:MAG TPA: T9SS type A sorting domain-containing protein, partial [Ignavibacteria bacterium]|nr:T9SS type A sorting domain-containing protein [Ignavibacteria bacterium]